MSNRYSNAEVRSGCLIIVAGLVLLSLIFNSGRSQMFAETKEIQIVFNYISGLERNAPVHYAGHSVGKVTNIQLLGSDSGMIAVTATIKSAAKLRKNSRAHIDMMGFMGEKFVELTAGTEGAGLLEEGEILHGTDPLSMVDIMAMGTELADEFKNTTIEFKTMIGQIQNVLSDNRTNIGGMFENLNTTSANLKDITQEPLNDPKIQSILTSLESTSRNLEEMTEDIKRHPWKLLKKGKEEKTR